MVSEHVASGVLPCSIFNAAALTFMQISNSGPPVPSHGSIRHTLWRTVAFYCCSFFLSMTFVMPS